MHWHFAKKETRLAYPGERLIPPGEIAPRPAPLAPRPALSDPLTAHCVEEMRSLQMERQDEGASERWQRLGRRDACGDVVPAGAGINERLISERLYEIESRCRGRGSDPCACDY